MQEIGQAFKALAAITGSMSVSILCALIGALIYAKRGKPWIGGAFLGFILGPLGVFLALVTAAGPSRPRPVYAPPPVYTPPVHTPPPQPPAPRREYQMPGRCPNCNGPVHQHRSEQAWTVCFYCGAQIEGRLVR